MIITRLHLEIAAIIAGLGIAAWAVNEHIEHVKAETVAQVTEAANKNALQIIAQHDAENKANLEAFIKANQAQVDSLRQTVLALKTPQQQVQWSQQQLADALKGIQITLNPKTGEAQATIPAASIPQLPEVIEKCQTCELNLSAATQKLTFADQQHANDEQKLALLAQDNEKWKQAAKGGTWRERAWHDTKAGAIGAAIVFVVACATGHCPR